MIRNIDLVNEQEIPLFDRDNNFVNGIYQKSFDNNSFPLNIIDESKKSKKI